MVSGNAYHVTAIGYYIVDSPIMPVVKGIGYGLSFPPLAIETNDAIASPTILYLFVANHRAGNVAMMRFIGDDMRKLPKAQHLR